MAIYWITAVFGGKLGVMPRPRGGDWLSDAVQAFREEGADVLVSLLTPAEQRELELEGEAEACRQHGLTFLTYPIPDYQTPPRTSQTLAFLKEMAQHLASGQNVVVHCRAGIGRSTTLIAALLVQAGWEAEAAWRQIEQARGRPVPDTPEQRAWVAWPRLQAVDSQENLLYDLTP